MIKVKVCGISNSENLKSLLTLPVDMAGFVFDHTSDKNCTLTPEEVKKAFSKNNLTCKKVGIFVDATLAEVLEKQEQYELDYVQLNGKESIFYCQLLREHQLKLIKSFSIDNQFCYSNTSAYGFFCDYFLFDYKRDSQSEDFNFDNLKKYKGKKPFLLNGDIGAADIDMIRNVASKQLSYVNIDRAFKIESGYKNLDTVADFIYRIKRPESFNVQTYLKRASGGI